VGIAMLSGCPGERNEKASPTFPVGTRTSHAYLALLAHGHRGPDEKASRGARDRLVKVVGGDRVAIVWGSPGSREGIA
jgi:hypothetical protein